MADQLSRRTLPHALNRCRGSSGTWLKPESLVRLSRTGDTLPHPPRITLPGGYGAKPLTDLPVLAACLLILTWCLASAPWHLLASSTRQHAWMGLTVALMLVWHLPARMGGYDFHLAGASLAALMFGPRLSAASFTIVLAVMALYNRMDPGELALQGLFLALLPALLTSGVQRLIETRLPHHPFLYVMVTAFGGTLAVNVVSVLVYVHALAWLSADTGRMRADFLPYRLLLCLGEAELTGMLAAVLLAWRPLWLTSFRDEIYLAPPDRRDR